MRAAPPLDAESLVVPDEQVGRKRVRVRLKDFDVLGGVDGVAIAIGWSAIEPVMGQFQFASPGRKTTRANDERI